MSQELLIKPPEPQALTPTRLIELALEKGADPEKLGQLMELQFKWEANEARKAWVGALHAFKASPPAIEKTKEVSYKNKDNSMTTYNHAELDVVNDVIQPTLSKHGLHATWRSDDNNGRIIMTCVLEHVLGHKEDISTLSGPADTSGGKNNIQAIGSTTSYLKRYTLLSGLGLVPRGGDDDGVSSEGMDASAVEDYCIQMKDSSDLKSLQGVFRECYAKAKAINDGIAEGTFVKVYEARKRELR